MKKLSQMDPAARQARIRALIAAGNSAAVPTRYLPADRAQQRNLNARLNAPVVDGSSLTNRDVARQAKANVQLQYGPQETALNQQLASNQNQAGQTGGYYQAWLDSLRAAQQQQPAVTQGTVSQLQGIGSSMQAASNQGNQQLLAQLQQDAASRGATVDPGVAQRFQQGTQVNAGVQGAQAGTAALQGQNQQGYLGALLGAAELGKIQALNQVAGKRSDLLAQQGQLRAQEGAANVDFRAKAVTQEGQNVLNSALASSTIGSRQASAQVAQTNARTAQRRAGTAAKAQRTQAQVDAGRLAETQRHNRTAEQIAQQRANKPPASRATKKPPTGPGSLTGTAEAKIVTQVSKVSGLLRSPTKQVKDANGNVTVRPTTAKDVIASLQAQLVDPRVIQLARDIVANEQQGRKNTIGQDGVRQAHNLGIHVGGRWKIYRGRP